MLHTDPITEARLAKADRLVSYLDTLAQRRGLDLSDHRVAAGMADRFREAPASFWSEVARGAQELAPSPRTVREVVRAYEVRAANLADDGGVAAVRRAS